MEEVAREVALLLAGGTLAAGGGALQQWFAHRLREGERRDDRRDEARAALPELYKHIGSLEPLPEFQPPDSIHIERHAKSDDAAEVAAEPIAALSLLDHDSEVRELAKDVRWRCLLSRVTCMHYHEAVDRPDEKQREFYERARTTSASALAAIEDLAQAIR